MKASTYKECPSEEVLNRLLGEHLGWKELEVWEYKEDGYIKIHMRGLKGISPHKRHEGQGKVMLLCPSKSLDEMVAVKNLFTQEQRQEYLNQLTQVVTDGDSDATTLESGSTPVELVFPTSQQEAFAAYLVLKGINYKNFQP